MINAELVGSVEVQAHLDKMSKSMHEGVGKAILMLTIDLQRHIMQDKLSGQVLKTRSSNLRNSITYRIENNGMTGVVGTNVNTIPYARIHEFGGVIAAKRAKYLRFQIAGKWISRRSVTMPKRSYLHSALKDMEPKIKEEILKQIHGAIA